MPALTITKLYRLRWQIELFFKWIKQHLRIKAFFGTTENAVKTQIWIAVSVYVLVAIVKKRLQLSASLYEILQILSLTMFERMPIDQLLSLQPIVGIEAVSPNQLTLFDQRWDTTDFYPLIAAVIVAAFGWEKFAWRTGAAILLAIVGLALALDVRGNKLNVTGVSLAFLAAVGLAVVVAVSSRVFGNGDARPVTLYMSAAASVLLLLLCAANGDFAFPQTKAGWIGFGAAAAFYGFAIITFFIAISMIGPVRASLFSYPDAVISAILGVVVLGQALTVIQVAGISLVIMALISATVRRNRAT